MLRLAQDLLGIAEMVRKGGLRQVVVALLPGRDAVAELQSRELAWLPTLVLAMTPDRFSRIELVARQQRVTGGGDEVNRRADVLKLTFTDEVVEVHSRPARL